MPFIFCHAWLNPHLHKPSVCCSHLQKCSRVLSHVTEKTPHHDHQTCWTYLGSSLLVSMRPFPQTSSFLPLCKPSPLLQVMTSHAMIQRKYQKQLGTLLYLSTSKYTNLLPQCSAPLLLNRHTILYLGGTFRAFDLVVIIILWSGSYYFF